MEAIEGPTQRASVQRLESPTLEREGHEGNFVWIMPGDLVKSAYREHHILEAVGGILLRDGARPYRQVSNDAIAGIGIGIPRKEDVPTVP